MPITPWTVSKIVDQVNGRTENRAVNKPHFDIRFEFFTGLDEFCQQRHYWWRRKMFSFATVIDQQDYDLSDADEGNAPDLVEIEEIFVINSNPQWWPYSVPPQFTAREQVGAVYGQPNIAQLVPRSGYFLTPGQFQQLTFSQAPNTVYTIAGTYYAVPMVTDTSIDDIPLVPPNLHFGLVYMLERRIYEYLYGQQDPRWTVSNKRYEDFLESAARSHSFSQQQAIHASAAGGAIRASGGRGVYRGGRS